jgi:hypothetical protein
MNLLEQAEILASAAEEARLAGDTQASIELAIAAAQRLQLIRIQEKWS